MPEKYKIKNIKDVPLTSGEGWFSRVWGTFGHAINNIIGIVIFVLLLFAIIYTFTYPFILRPNVNIKEFLITPREIWSFVIPALLSAIGYLIGRAK